LMKHSTVWQGLNRCIYHASMVDEAFHSVAGPEQMHLPCEHG
jgi:hypothetical protein